jgi:hypothetical protein
MHPDAFAKKYDVDPVSGCWLWRLHVNACGYGTIRSMGQWLAHRVSWMIHRGPIPQGVDVCHSCDVPRCVNPDHLWLGSHLDNMRDMDRKGRCLRGGPIKLTADDVDAIRAMRVFGTSQQFVADRFGVSQVMISRIWRYKNWTCERRAARSS